MTPTENAEQAALFQWAELASGAHPELRLLQNEEEWRFIKNTNWLYIVSNFGRVVRLPYSSTRVDGVRYNWDRKEIAQTKDARGYLCVGLSMSDGRRKTYKVHRLVMEAFTENPHNKPQINHIDSDKTNNRLENLEWVDQYENMEHSVIALTKWTKPVRCINNGEVFKSMRSAARNFGIGHKEISMCCRRILKSTGGLSFEFASKEDAINGTYRATRAASVV